MVLQVLLFGLVALQAEAAAAAGPPALESTVVAEEAQQPSICLNETGFAFVSAAGCRAGATPFTHTGADAFNILWSVWAPTQAPHPPHTGNWSTSAATLEQMAAAKLPFARVFGSPWGWEQILFWRSDTEMYWANMTRVVAKAKAVGVRLHLSITPTLSQFAIAAGCASTRELITNEGASGCRDVLKEYVQDMVGRFKDDATILSWGMGNELNLEADGCSYNKSRGEYFSTAEMMAFSTLYVSWVKELDPLRPMGSDMGQARTRANHLAALKGGGAACVNAHNPKGDCEVNCSAVQKDSLADFKQVTKFLSAPFDLVSVHNYGCYPPFAEFSFCNGDNTSIAALQAAKEVADEMGKPLFVGEFGSPACNVAGGAGWDSEECLAFPRKLLDYQVKSGIQLSNAWTWCQDGAAWCINDGKGAEKIMSLLQATDRKLNEDQHRALVLAKRDDTGSLKTDDATTATMDTPLISAKNAFRYARAHLAPAAPQSNTCGWGRSTYMIGLWEYYAATVAANAPDLVAKGHLADWGRRLDYELCKGDGTAWTGSCATGNLSGCANNQQAAAVYIELYKAGLDLPVPHAEATLRPIIAEFNAEIALGSATEGSWPSVDLTMMAVAPLARLGALTGEPKYFEKLWANWNATMLMAEGPLRGDGTVRLRASYGLFNQADRLFGQSDNNGDAGGANGYWSRGNGWAMLSLVDAIRFGGDADAATGGAVADPHHEKYIAIFRLFAGRLLELQGDDGAWRSSLLETTKFPTRETTGTACFTRGLAYGIIAGLLDARTYVPAVTKAWEFLSRSALQPSGRVGYCQNSPGRPTNEPASLNASTTSGYCVGLLLGAAAEVSRLADYMYVTEQEAAGSKQLNGGGGGGGHEPPSLPSLATDDEQAKADRPHILTIIVDDMGSYDSAINNPDSFMTQQGFGAITKEGIRLTHHMAYLYCSPSRRSILSGRFPNHIGTAQAPICSNFLPLQFTLLPARLKAVGYATHMIGKGHLGYMTTDHMPVKRGFDSHVGFLYHGEDYHWGNTGVLSAPGHAHGQTNCEGSNITNDEKRFCKKDMWHDKETGWDVVNDIDYSTNFYTKRSVDLIRAHDPQKPFYLHLTYQAVHNPCEEPPLSQQIPNASVPGEWWDQTWGSMLNALDQGIANVTTALRAKDMWKNTLLVLVSDNGGDDLVSPSDPTGRTTMANNYPYRGTKLTAWEGGTRTAAVIGGGFVPVQLRGSSSDALLHIADWYPTLANIAGAIATDPVFINGSVHDVDGVDMWPAITGANTTSPRPWLPTTQMSILWQQTDGSIYKFISSARRTILFSPNGTIRNDTSALGWNGTHAVQCVWASPTNPDATCTVCDPVHPCLFEIKGDPSESRNLASDPAHASTLAVMAAKLASYVPYVDGNMSAAELQDYDCPDMDPDGSRSLWGTYVGPCCTPSEKLNGDDEIPEGWDEDLEAQVDDINDGQLGRLRLRLRLSAATPRKDLDRVNRPALT